MPPHLIAALDKELDWPMTPADTADAERAAFEQWGLGADAQRNQNLGLGMDLDDLPVARSAE